MLFNSPEFLFAFLPITLAVYWLLVRSRVGSALLWLVGASLLFYGWWNPRYLLLIGVSIVVNYTISRWMVRSPEHRRRLLLMFGVCANLLCIGYFKYAMFVTENINDLFSTELTVGTIILPLAISFFTFQQITFLVDTYRDRVQDFQFSHYCLFVLFFPQLIAGPIVHHKEMMPQFAALSRDGLADNFNRGFTVFALGLFKKVAIADTLAVVANPAFSMAETGAPLSPLDAWCGALAYTFQLYFDFSGYSDMAIGLAILFGISLPLNFFSPYKSRNIIDFWRRWHMTLSRFLRDYVYIPIGGNRRGAARKHVNLMITMLVGGVWHGAGWTFIIWGGLHGVYLVINHLWRAVLTPVRNTLVLRINRLFAPVLTFACVVLAWVYFRAESVGGAHHMLGSMLDASQITGMKPGFSPAFLAAVGEFPLYLILQPLVQDAKAMAILLLIAMVAFIAFCMPNPVDLMRERHPGLQSTLPAGIELSRSRLCWQPNLVWALVMAVLLLITLASASGLSPFLYFQF